MAKKKKNKSKKKVVAIVMDLLTMLFGGLILGFMALPHITYKYKQLNGDMVYRNTSAYKLIDFDANKNLSIVLILLMVCSALLVLFGFLKLFSDAGASNALIDKVIAFFMVLVALAIIVVIVFVYIQINNYVESLNDNFILTGTYYMNLTYLIINTCASVFALGTTICSMKK